MSSLKSKLKNITAGKVYIANILQHYNEDDDINHPDVIELLSYHPTKHITKDTIEYLKLKVRKPFNKLALFYKYRHGVIEDDISYILCIKNLFGKYNRDKQYEEDVMSAFRNESHVGTKKKYFIDNTSIENDVFIGVCNNCKRKTKDITTDHHILPYKQIFQDFLKQEGVILLDVDILENEQNEIRIKDIQLAMKWREYHDSKAQYRLLCKSCNSHFGAYGL
jgi:hypothetical protein